MNWIFPGCQLFYRDTDADIDVQKTYPIGHVIRAGFFVDVTVKAQRPKTRFRFIIAYSGGYPFSISGDIRSLPS